MNCPHCGKDSDPLFHFCMHCGKELMKAPARSEARPAAEAVKTPEPVAEKPAPAQELPPEPERRPEKVARMEEKFETMRCPRCRAKMKIVDEICRLCGYRIEDEKTAETPPSQDARVETPQAEDPSRVRVGFLISVKPTETRETVKLPLYEGRNSVGRSGCDICFPEDDLLSPVHLEVEVTGSKATFHCPNSRNGTYLRMTDQTKLKHLTLFRVGQQLLRLEELEELEPFVASLDSSTVVLGSPAGPRAWGRLTQIVTETVTGSSFLLVGENVFIGRDRGNITFPSDRYISGTHAVLSRRADGTYLRDIGSSNGTFVRMSGSWPVDNGRYFLAGRQLFKLYLG